MLPSMSFLTGVKATDPRRSDDFQQQESRQDVEVYPTEQRGCRFCRLEELAGRDPLIFWVNCYINEGLFMRVKPGPARWNLNCTSHCYGARASASLYVQLILQHSTIEVKPLQRQAGTNLSNSASSGWRSTMVSYSSRVSK
jgi:hypothetical protein